MSTRQEWAAYYKSLTPFSDASFTYGNRITLANRLAQLSDSEFNTFKNLYFRIEGTFPHNFPKDSPDQIYNDGLTLNSILGATYFANCGRRLFLATIGLVQGGVDFNSCLYAGKNRYFGSWARGVLDNVLNERQVPSTPQPEPVAETVLIDGVPVDPGLTYTATIYNSAGDAISSGVFKGSDMIALVGTNVTIKIGVDTTIEQPSPEQLTPKNPFYIDPEGNKVYIKENIQRVLVQE